MTFLQCCQWQIFTMNKLKIFWINLRRWQNCMHEGTTRFGEILTKVFFVQGTQELMAKLPKLQKWFWKFGKLCPFMSALNEQHLVYVCSHLFKLNKAKCVHSLPQKRGLRPKPVPGRGCPSLKLRLCKSDREAATEAPLPDRSFHNFRASKSVDRRLPTTQSLSRRILWL